MKPWNPLSHEDIITTLPGLLVVLMLYFAEVSAAPGAAALPFLIDVAILWKLLLFPLAEKKTQNQIPNKPD